jgi:hypothetical protein
MGGGKGGMNQDLADMSSAAFKMGKPAMQAALDTFMEALQTGGVESRTPKISQAVERTGQMQSQAQASMAEDMARSGVSGTPFGQQIMASMQQQGAQQLAYLPTQMQTEDYWKILSMFYPGAGASMGMGVQGMGTAAQTQAQSEAALGQLFSQMFGSTAGMMGSALAKPSVTNVGF